MAKFRSIKNSFLGGEISPQALGRTDLPIYTHSCETLLNVLPYKSGGVYRRPGTRYSHATAGEEGYFIPFVVSQDKAYLLDISTANVDAYESLASLNPTIIRTTNAIGAVPTGVYLAYQARLQYVQSADVLWLVDGEFLPRKITRTTVNDAPVFTYSYFDSGLSGTALRDAWPYQKMNTTSTTMVYASYNASNPRTPGSTVTITSSADYFTSTMVGSTYKTLMYDTPPGTGTKNFGCFKITEYVSATSVRATVIVDPGPSYATAVTSWWAPLWSGHYGYPTTVGFHQDRLFFGGQSGPSHELSPSSPDTLCFSRAGEYAKLSDIYSAGGTTTIVFDPYSDPSGDDAFSVILLSQQLNNVSWAVSESGGLMVGTTGDEFLVGFNPTTTFSGFCRETVSISARSHHGTAAAKPARGDNEIFAVTKSRGKIVSFAYSEQLQSYEVSDIQSLYEHRPEYTYKRVDWDGGRSILWCLDSAGSFWGFHRDRKNSINQVLRQTFSGTVTDFCLVPNPALGVADLWLKIARVINGTTVYCAERISGQDLRADSIKTLSPYYPMVDSARVTAFTVANPFVLTRDTHLKGYELTISAQVGTKGWFKLTSKTANASTGGYTLDLDPWYVVGLSRFEYAGIPYTSVVKPVRLEAGSQIGSAQGAIKRIHKVIVRFYKTIAAKIGRDATNIETIPFTLSTTPLDESPEYFTGDKEIFLDSDYDTDGYVYLIQDEPLPFSVVSIIAEGVTND